MLSNAREQANHRIKEEKSREKFIDQLKNNSYILKSSWCGTPECEDKIKAETGATSRLIPLEEEELISKDCIFCGNKAKFNAYFAKSY